jgi:site-specific DNA recombinase
MSEKCIIINRVSSQEQADTGYSLDAQSEFGNLYAKKKKFKVLKEFTFSESASKTHIDKKFNEILNYIEKHTEIVKGSANVLHVVVEKSDRLARTHGRMEKIHNLIKQRRIFLHYYKENKILDYNCSPQEILVENFMTSLNQYAAENIGREAKKGMIARAKQGWIPAKPPAGYLNNPDKGSPQKIIINEAEREYVTSIFELRAEGLSYNVIVNRLKVSRKVPMSRLSSFRKSTVEKILKNPFFRGEFEFCGEIHPGKHELIVPGDVYSRAMGVMRATTRKTLKKHQGLFSDRFVCADCGCKITYHPKKNNKFLLYVCSNGKKKHKSLSGLYWNEERLKNEFEQVLDSISLTEQLAELISDRLNERHKKLRRQLKREESSYKENLKVLEIEEDMAYEKLMGSVIDDLTYKKQIRRLREQRDELNSKILKVHELHSDIYLTTAQMILELAKNAKTLWRRQDMNNQIELMDKLLWNSALSDTSTEFNLKKPFKMLSVVKENQGNEKWGGFLASPQTHTKLHSGHEMCCCCV